MNSEILIEKIQQLPNSAQDEIMDFIEFIQTKYDKNKPIKKDNELKFDWEGGLSDLKETYTSVELQHQANNWR